MTINDNEEEIKVGSHVVIFSYTNTRPEYQGKVISVSDHFLQIEQDGFYGKILWEPREKVEKIKSYKL